MKILRMMMSRNNFLLVCQANPIDLKATVKIVLLIFDIDLTKKNGRPKNI
jgi:hypothetical protein